VGLTRSLAPGAAAHDITVNCVCPAMVLKGLEPPGLMERFPREHVTLMSMILRAFDELMDEKANRNGGAWKLLCRICFIGLCRS